jgi:hypothetical protein
MATHKQDHRPDEAVGTVEDLNEVPPKGIEPDLTPAPGSEPGLPSQEGGFSQSQTLGGQTQSQGVGQSQTQRDDLGFDPDSPDLADPQVDPVGKAEIPDDAPGAPVEKRVDDDQYPPYNA